MKKAFEQVKQRYEEARVLPQNVRGALARAKLRRRLELQPAISTNVLEESGLSVLPNINYGEFTAAIRKRTDAVLRSLLFTESYITVMPRQHDPTGVAVEVGRGLARGFSKYLDEPTNPFLSRLRVAVREIVAYGYAGWMWADMREIVPQLVLADDMLFTPVSRTEPSGLGAVYVFRSADLADMERWASSKTGWIPRNVETYAREMNEAYPNVGVRRYGVVFAFETNEDGRMDVWAMAAERVGKMKSDLLGHWPNYAEENDLIQAVFYEPADGYALKVRGLGHALYASTLVSDDLLNRTVSGCKIAMSLLVKPRMEDATDLVLHDRGPLLVLDPRAETEATRISGELEAGIMVRNVLDINRNNLFGVYKAGREAYPVATRTATEVSAAARYQDMEEDAAALYIGEQMSRVFERMFRLFLKRPDVVKKYVGDIDRSFLDKELWQASANMNAQASSVGGAVAMARTILEVMPAEESPEARNKMRRIVYEAIGGRKLAQELMPALGDMPSSEDSRQDVENIILSGGAPVSVGMDDHHVSHIRRMFAYFDALLQQAQSNQNALVNVRFDALLAHLRGHIAAISTVPMWKAFYSAALKQLQKVAVALEPILALQQRLMQEQADRQALAQNQPENMSPATMIKLREMEGRLRIGERRADVQAELARRRADVSEELARRKVQSASEQEGSAS